MTIETTVNGKLIASNDIYLSDIDLLLDAFDELTPGKKAKYLCELVNYFTESDETKKEFSYIVSGDWPSCNQEESEKAMMKLIELIRYHESEKMKKQLIEQKILSEEQL